MLIETHDTRTVAQLCGFGSVAMLDYLERSGVFVPERRREKGKGRRRRYTFRDVLILKAIAAVLRNGASVASLKDALVGLQRIQFRAEETVLEDKAGPLRHLVVSGSRIYLCRSRDELVDLAMGGQMTFSFVIDLDQLHSQLAKEWRQNRLQFAS